MYMCFEIHPFEFRVAEITVLKPAYHALRQKTSKTTGGGTVVLANDYMPVVPVITVTAETTLRWAIDGESFQKTVSQGTWEIPELELRHGDNSVSVTGEGNVTFVYREGRL